MRTCEGSIGARGVPVTRAELAHAESNRLNRAISSTRMAISSGSRLGRCYVAGAERDMKAQAGRRRVNGRRSGLRPRRLLIYGEEPLDDTRSSGT